MRRRVRIIRSAERDEFGDRIGEDQEFYDRYDWVIGVAVGDDSSDGKQNRVETRVQCFVLDGGTDARASDVVRIDGETFQVDGRPSRAESPFTGRLGGYVINLKKYEG